jgi:hypothetical protein
MHASPTVHRQRLTGRGGSRCTLHGPIGELAAALRTLADALDQEQANSPVTYTATVEPRRVGRCRAG